MAHADCRRFRHGARSRGEQIARRDRARRSGTASHCRRTHTSMTLEHQPSDWDALATQALAGDIVRREDARAVLRAPDEDLLAQLNAAYRVRRHYWGNRVRLHFLLNAQSGLCPEDCHYCSQSSVSTAEIERYPMLAQERILAAAERAATLRAGTLCLVISGRSPGERVFQKVLDAVRAVRGRYDLKICTCLGLLNADQTRRLAEAGVETVNHNLNTSERHHETVCTTHTFADRRATV